MKEYIKRIDAMLVCEIYSNHCFKVDDSAGQNIADKILDTIGAIPTADVREVKHGKWEECDWVKFNGHDECIHYPKQGVSCSECRNAFKKELLWKDNFCPNCGAIMDGGNSAKK